MFANQLGQTLLVECKTPFATIEKVMSELGWSRENQSPETPPLMRDEPEFATWSFGGLKPFVIYTFNPVVSMRVLDVATLPPAMRSKLAEKLPIIDDRKISALFESDDVKERLLALWAAQETERVDWLKKVERLKSDPESIIGEQAELITNRLKSMNAARISMLTELKVLGETAPKLISQLTRPKFVQSLKPTQADLKKLFDEYLVDSLTACVEAIYKQQPRIQPLEYDSSIEVFASPAGLLRWPNMLSNKFPGGYRDIAGWMNPHCIWMAWTITTPVGGATRYDGLVWLENKWLWLPKIFRYLTPYLMTSAASSSSHH
jgi:hypothetical protein